VTQPYGLGWRVVGGWSHVTPGLACRVELFGEEIALWRTEAGAVHAWSNRCPHRGMRLSYGQVRGDRLACRYHGWHYDGTGRCRFIPAHPKLDPPATLAVARHAALEQDEAIWVALGDAPADPPGPLGADRPGFCRTFPLALSGASGAEALREVAGASPLGPDLMAATLSLNGDARSATIAIQPIDAARCVAHIFLDGAPDPAARVAAARWAAALRREIAQMREPRQ